MFHRGLVNLQVLSYWVELNLLASLLREQLCCLNTFLSLFYFHIFSLSQLGSFDSSLNLSKVKRIGRFELKCIIL
jgi:hypothetical protein